MAVTAASTVEGIKAASNQLRGTIGEELSDATPAFSHESQQLLRFHGIYQQDDRDVRNERKRQGLDVDHICMVRVSVPGGILTAEQYLMLDTLCDAVASGTLRITSRQGIQYHFVRKGDLHGPSGHSQRPLGDHPRRLRRRGPQHHVLPGAIRRPAAGRRGRLRPEGGPPLPASHPRLLPAVARR